MTDPDCLAIYEDAEFYDREFHSRAADIEFWRQRSLRAEGEVLEIACGTGRITLPLARAGVRITGLDVSAPMLELARRKAEAEKLSIDWIVADCREFVAPRRYRLIFIATNALQHLHDDADVEAFFHCVLQHLEPDGVFILDVFNPNVTKLGRPPGVRHLHREIPAEGNGTPLRVEVASNYDAASQLLRFELYYIGPDGETQRTKNVAMRCFFPLELAILCRHSGLQVVETLGSYDEQSFTSASPQQILVCRSV